VKIREIKYGSKIVVEKEIPVSQVYHQTIKNKIPKTSFKIRTIKNAQEITNEVMEEVPFVKYNRVPTSVEQIKYSPEELIQTTEKTVEN